MTFAAARARDATFILERAAGEFNVAVLFWDEGLDPDVDAATTTTRGVRFTQPGDRMEDSEGQSETHMVLVQVTKTAVSAIDVKGTMQVDGENFAIEYATADDISWSVKGIVQTFTEYGDASRSYGG